MSAIVGDIFDLFARHGSGGYGEDLSLEQHMLQSAALAESLGAPAPVIVAALLHDIGYFLQADTGAVVGPGQDFAHEALGAVWLSRAFDEAVTAPIALHVEAKRYLCATEPGYLGRLSEASKISLAVQGGVMSRGEVAAFARHPAFETALLLRRCDDQGKDVSLSGRSMEQYRALLTATAR
jgi:[1-hydroxy-2-(trimethylamino)ethyl]phosphonate dioxygenase